MILRRFTRRAGWGIADQAASSFVNFALGVFVARQTTTEAFGAFSIAFLTYLLCLNIGRSIVAKPLMIRYSGDDVAGWQHATSRGMIAGLAFACAAGAICIAVGVVLSVSDLSGLAGLGSALAAMGIAMPGLLAQDAWRFAFFAAGRGKDAFINDAIRAALLVAIFGLFLVLEVRAVPVLILGWGLSGAGSAIAGILQSRAKLVRGALRSWLREHWDLIPQFTAESIVNVGSIQLNYVLVGVLGGLGAVGTIRAGDLILGPFNILSMGIFLVVLPEATHVLKTSARALARWTMRLSLGLAGSALLFGAVCLTIPDEIGRLYLGNSWDPARSVLIPLVISLMSVVGGSAATTALRALEAATRVLRASAVAAVLLLTATSAGVWVGAALGAAWGMAIGSSLGAVVWWFELLREVRRRENAALGIGNSLREINEASRNS